MTAVTVPAIPCRPEALRMIPDGPDRWIDLAGDLHIIRASEVFYWRDATAVGVAAVAEAIGGGDGVSGGLHGQGRD